MDDAVLKTTPPGLNIAPLIDVVFLLLIFFMLSSRFVRDRGIEVDLPTAAAARACSSCDAEIFIRKNGDIFAGGEALGYDEVTEYLRRALAPAQKKSVSIRADGDVALSKAVKVMDAAKKAGAAGIAVLTEREELHDE